MNKFNQKEYINEYNKQHYSIFKVSLKKEEKEELNKLLKQNNLTNADFLRNAIKDLKGAINNEKN
nr:MAG TPA: NikA, BACTERIAL CONJUGATION, RELAXASE, DNA [Caudoviricetes sp.]